MVEEALLTTLKAWPVWVGVPLLLSGVMALLLRSESKRRKKDTAHVRTMAFSPWAYGNYWRWRLKAIDYLMNEGYTWVIASNILEEATPKKWSHYE